MTKIEEARRAVNALRLEVPEAVMEHFAPLMKEVLDQAEENEFYIDCLHAGGVDNWEWFGESLEPYYEKYHS